MAASGALSMLLETWSVSLFSAETILLAQTMVEELFQQRFSKNMSDKDYFISALIIAEIIQSQTNGVVPLKQILSLFQTSLSQILRALDSFVKHIHLEEDIKAKLFLLYRDEIIFLMFFEKYESIMDKCVKLADPEVKRFGWFLFAHTKNHFLRNNPHDYEKNVTILICSMSLFYCLYPGEKMTEQELNSSDARQDVLILDQAGVLSEELPKILRILCKYEKTSFTMAENFFSEHFWPFLLSISLTPALDFKTWLLPEHIGLNVELLSKEQEKWCSPFRLDFRDIDREGNSVREVLTSPNGSQMNLESELAFSLRPPVDASSSPLSQINPPTATPTIENSVPSEVIQWLEKLLPEKAISETIESFFSACSNSPRTSILSRFQLLSEMNLPDSLARNVEKFYFHVLEAMLLGEQKRTGKTDFSTLLNHSTFHNSLLACSYEVVSFVFQVNTVQFPDSVALFHINTFELSKLIDNVLRFESTMPNVVKLHLISIDQRILQTLLWKSGSPIFELLDRGKHPLQNHLEQLMKEKLGGSASVPVSSRSQLYSPVKSPGTPFRSFSLEIIYTKLMRLALSRSKKLVFDLGMRDSLPSIVQTILNVLTQSFHLLENRHLDQIIICTVYGVARATKLEVSFRKILQHYKSQPQAESSVWKSVLLKEGETSDIINFYNAVFIGAMEKYLLEFQTTPAKISLDKLSDTKIMNSPIKTNFTLNSPLSRKRRGDAFVVGQSPVKDLRRYNEGRVLSNNRKKVSRRLFTGLEEEETGNPTKKQKISLEDSAPILGQAITSITNNEMALGQGPSILRKRD